MVTTNPQTIVLKGNFTSIERVAAEAITPGHLIDFNTSNQFVKNADSRRFRFPVVAIEREYLGDEITDAYASGDTVLGAVLYPGCEALLKLPAGADAVLVGVRLEAGNNGTVRWAGTVTDISALTENGGAIGGTNDGDLPDISTVGGTYVQAEVTAIRDAVREIANKVNAGFPFAIEMPVGIALEAVNNSGGGTEANIKVLVI